MPLRLKIALLAAAAAYHAGMPALSKRKPSAPATSSQERVIWRGTISFGLVQIPAGLFRAEPDSALHLTMLDKKATPPCGSSAKLGGYADP